MRTALVLAFALALFGCSDDLAAIDATFTQSDMSGSVRIPLTATDADGTSYRLRGATFEISGAAMVTLSERGQPGADDSLASPLPSGEYRMYLRPGWQLVQIKADGSESTASAELLSKNPLAFDVSQLGDANLKLVFKSGEKQLSFGSGSPVRVTTASIDSLHAL